MKLLVAVKRVIDADVRVRVRADGSGVETEGVKMSMNPFDEIALEEAVRMKEAGLAEELVVVSLGESRCQETLRTALALGADRAILVESTEPLQPLAVAKLLRVVVEREQPDLVLLGRQAIDDDSTQTGQMLAGLLGWPQGTFVSRIEHGEAEVTVTREIDGGQERIRLELPAVITVDLRLNEPRFATLPGILRAKKKPLEVLPAEGLGVDIAPRLEILEVAEPPPRKAGVRLDSVAELVARLKDEAKVL